MPNYSANLWEYKYSPKTINEMILPESYKSYFNKWFENKDPFNCILYSTHPGCGKSTICDIIKKSDEFSVLFINASKETSIDNVRYNIKNFISTVSFKNSPKVVILDEGDRISANAADALKGEIETNANNSRFIITANRVSSFEAPFISRLPIINFDKIYIENKKELLKMAYNRFIDILNKEHIEYEKEAVIEIIKKFAPSWRNIIKQLQLISSFNNKITLSDIKNMDINNDILNLIEFFKSKDFNSIRTYLVKHSGMEIELINGLFEITKNKEYFTEPNKGIPSLILLLGDSQRYITSVPSPEIELCSLCLNIISQVEFN